MRYFFNIANIVISIETDFNIDWNPFMLDFLCNDVEKVDYSYKCIVKDELDDISGQLLYQGDSFYVYKNEKEERLFLLPYSDEPMIMYKEIDNHQRILYIRKKYLKYMVLPTSFTIFNALALEKIMLEHDAFILHSSFISYHDQALLFTAPSGTGKSTQADLWKKYRDATIVNGDRTLLKRENNVWYAYGFPLCGSSSICVNTKVPLKAIIYLSQAKENSVKKVELSQYIRKIISETSINFWNDEFVNKMFDLISDMVINIPMVHLSCTKDERAVKIIEEKLGV